MAAGEHGRDAELCAATGKPVVTQATTAATFKTILMGIGRVMVWSAAGYTYLVIMPTYLQSALHTGFNRALLIAVISNIGFALTIIPSGMLSDRIGRRTVMIISTVLLLILALPLLKILQAETSTLAVKAIVVLIAGGLVGMLAGPGPAMLSEMFPTRVRYTGLGLAYSLSNAIFSGCAGLIITGLIKETGNLDIPAYYVMATAVVSIFALMTLRKDDHLRSLEVRLLPGGAALSGPTLPCFVGRVRRSRHPAQQATRADAPLRTGRYPSQQKRSGTTRCLPSGC